MLKLFVFALVVICVNSHAIPMSHNPEENPGLFEGDIMGVDPTRGINVKTAVRWPNGIVPYVIDNSVPYTTAELIRIQVGIEMLADLTRVNGRDCVKAVPRTTQTNYVRVYKGSGCSSYVGLISSMLNGQGLSLASGCLSNGTIMHEFIHALGFGHEQARPDRDEYITVFYENIQAGTEGNFNKYAANSVDYLGFPYDYGSVMHYGKTGFSINGQPTILPLDPDAVIGQRVTLSPIDIGEIRAAYNCN